MVLTTPALNLKKERTSFTQEELSKLWVLHGQVYDFTDCVKYHPAGSRAILLGRGRDCTVLFESYHTILPSDTLLEKSRVSAPNVRTTPRAFPSLIHLCTIDYSSDLKGDVLDYVHTTSVLQLLLVWVVLLEAHLDIFYFSSSYFVSTWATFNREILLLVSLVC